MSELSQLSRREREIMEIVYRNGTATLTEILARVKDPPTRPALRSILGILESKGHLKHGKRGREFVYRPTLPRKRVGRTALKRVVDTFFSGSLGEAVASHLSDPKGDLSDEDLDELMALVEQKRGKNKKNTNAKLQQS
jgi:predicted transcriptional regulator